MEAPDPIGVTKDEAAALWREASSAKQAEPVDVEQLPISPEPELSPLGQTPSQPSIPFFAEMLVLLLISIAPTIVGWLPGRVFAPMDRAGGPGDRLADPRLNEAHYSVAWTQNAADRLGRQDFPLWDDSAPMGQPFLGIGRTGVFFPTTFLHLIFSPTWAWTLAVFIKLLAGAAGVWLLARRAGLSAPGRLLAAASFALSGLFLWSPHDALANVAAVTPWTIWAIDRLLGKISAHRIAVVAGFVALAFFGGDPSAIVSLVALCAAFVFVRMIFLFPPLPEYGSTELAEVRARGPEIILALLAALLVATVVAAIQVLPLAEYAHYFAANSASRIVHFRDLPIHAIFSNATKSSPAWIGALAIFLAIWAVFGDRERRTMGWVVIAAIWMMLTILFAMCICLFGEAEAKFLLGPGLLLGGVLVVAILAGRGMDAIVAAVSEGTDSSDHIARLFVWTAMCGGGIAAVVAIAGFIVRAKHPAILADAVGLAIAGAMFYICSQLLRRGFRPDWSILGVALITPILLAIIYEPTVSREQMLQAIPGDEPSDGTVADEIGFPIAGQADLNVIGKSPRTWLAASAIYYPNRADMLAHLRDGLDIDPRTTVLVDPDADNPKDQVLGRPGATVADTHWFNQASHNPQGQTVFFSHIAPETIDLYCSGDGWVVLANRLYPGWRATVNLGQQGRGERPGTPTPVIPAFGTMQSLFLPSGADQATFTYDPPSWRWGYFGSIAGFAVFALLLGSGFVMDQDDPKNPAIVA